MNPFRYWTKFESNLIVMYQFHKLQMGFEYDRLVHFTIPNLVVLILNILKITLLRIYLYLSIAQTFWLIYVKEYSLIHQVYIVTVRQGSWWTFLDIPYGKKKQYSSSKHNDDYLIHWWEISPSVVITNTKDLQKVMIGKSSARSSKLM